MSRSSRSMAFFLEQRASINRPGARFDGVQSRPEYIEIVEIRGALTGQRLFGGSALLQGLLTKGGQVQAPPKPEKPRRGRPPKAKGVGSMTDRPSVLQAVEALNDRVTAAHLLAQAFVDAGGEEPSALACVWQDQMAAMLAAVDEVVIEVRRHLGGEFA